MKRVRITYEGAFHHVMNRGFNGDDIFVGPQNKSRFLDYLEAISKKYKIRVYAYCIMDNHYHLIIQNTTRKMSEFLKQLNGQYGMFFRKRMGGKGYVFQSRYRSTLIEVESYLQTAIAYTLLNPLRAGLVKNTEDYIWSSLKDYYSNKKADFIETQFVEELFQSQASLFRFMSSLHGKELPVSYTQYGDILGKPEFIESAITKFDRREKEDAANGKRRDEKYFEPLAKVIMEFERMKGKKIDEIRADNFEGKRLRGELLAHLKDRGGLTYGEIIKFDIFSDLKYNSLGSIYRDSKNRMNQMKK